LSKITLHTSTQVLNWDEKTQILKIHCIEQCAIDLDAAIENIQARAVVRDKLLLDRVKVLIDFSNVLDISKEAREYLSSNEQAKVQSATALLHNGGLSYLVAKFFEDINIPISKTKLFDNVKDAEEWLISL
jgi:hypothetical protein